MKLPKEIERFICLELNILDKNKELSAYEKRIADLRKQMVMLSDNYTRSLVTDSKYADAYFTLNFPLNFMKSYFVTNRLINLFENLVSKNQMTILDLGCGEGGGMFGLFYALNDSQPNCSFTMTGVDISNRSNDRCRRLYDHLSKKFHNMAMQLITQSANSFIKKTNKIYDFVIISNALIEIFQSDTIPPNALNDILSLTSEDGILLIIEPALKKTTRRLMLLHDNITNDSSRILLPCLTNYPCPLLPKKHEWCHQSIQWTPPDYLQYINQSLYRKIEYLKFAYLVVSKHKYPLINADLYPVISRLYKEKGRKRCFICSKTGIVELMRLNRDQNSSNHDFDHFSIGDIIKIENVSRIRPLFWRITEKTRTKRLDF